MKTLSVCVQVTYNYEVEIPDDTVFEDEYDLLAYVDTEDPVYRDLCGVFCEAHLNYTGDTVSVIDADTGDDIYCK